MGIILPGNEFKLCASYGATPDRRGNDGNKATTASLTALQWGHAWTGVEFQDDCPGALGAIASRGHAWTGVGMSRLGSTRQSPHSFNGATPGQAWNGVLAAVTDTGEPQASMGHAWTGVGILHRSIPLLPDRAQWATPGQAWESDVAGGRAIPVGRSMGPRLDRRGNAPYVPQARVPALHGATPDRRGNTPEAQFNQPDTTLQWGHAWTGVESGPRPWPLASTPASMGPRLDRRGIRPTWEPSLALKLQWGHAWTGVGTLIPRGKGPAPTRFNGATPGQAWE